MMLSLVNINNLKDIEKKLRMFKGSIVALVTPFKGNDIDESSLRKLVDWHISEGTDGIVPVGTTGESPTLNHDEHERVVEIVIDQCNSRVPVIAGTGSNSTAEAINLLKHAENAGADAALVVTPYYNKPTPEGLYAHYEALDRASSGIPVIIYNIPSRSVIDINVDLMGRLSRLQSIVGVKDATSDISRIKKHNELCEDGFIQLSGEDETIYEYMINGGQGCISVTANILPKVCSDMHKAFSNNDLEEAKRLNNILMPLHKALFIETSPSPVKYILSKMNLIDYEVRLPLVKVRQETKSILDEITSNLEIK